MGALLAELGRWESLPFLVSFAVGLILLTLQLMGFGLHELLGGHDLDLDKDVDLDLDHGLDLDHDVHIEAGIDVDLDADLDADADLDHDLDHDHDLAHAAGSAGFMMAILTWLNVGRAPFIMVLQQLLLHFGLFGVIGLMALRQSQGLSGPVSLALAVPFALACAALVTKASSGLVARVMPTSETKGATTRSLLGLTANVTSARVDERGGRASVRDRDGDLFTVFCRTEPGAAELTKGERARLVAYRAADDRYLVRPATPPDGITSPTNEPSTGGDA